MLLKTKSLIIFLIFSLHLNAGYEDYIYSKQFPSYNSFGQIGLIQTPSAKNHGEGSLFFNINTNDIWKYGSLTISPFNWLEASYFYYRPSDLVWESNGYRSVGDYLDKGFNIKFTKSFKSIPKLNIAIGLDDFAGTGLFTKEYLVGTYDLNKLITLNIGLGWGYFNGESKGFKNIFSGILPDFEKRPSFSTNYKLGGSPSYDLWFRGNNSLFGGIEFNIPFSRGIKLKIEKDPFNYNKFTCCGSGISDQSNNLRSKSSDINFGFVFPLNNGISLSLSQFKGNMVNLTFSFGGNFSKRLQVKSQRKPSVKISQYSLNKKLNFYENLLSNLNSNEIFLQTAEISETNNLKLAVSSYNYIYPLEMYKDIGFIVNTLSQNLDYQIENLQSSLVNAGIELHTVSTPTRYLPVEGEGMGNSIPMQLVARQTKISSGNGSSFQKNEFRPIVRFPEIDWGTSFSLRNHIGDPAKFYYGGLDFNIDGEIKFSRYLILEGSIAQAISDDFDEKSNFPDSRLPHVRTDIVRYLQDSETYISRLQLNYFAKPLNKLFFKASAGILESMYGGVGVELLYRPFRRNFSIGSNYYIVKKRAFDQKLSFLDFKTDTGHINLNYFHNYTGIDFSLSFGKYLAGDKGYTFDIARELQSGFKAGIFFTRTNVSAELFGEGSFDKGFYFQIPYDLFFSNRRGGFFNFTLRPLTRDGGQKLEQGSKISGIFHHTLLSEIERDWVHY